LKSSSCLSSGTRRLATGRGGPTRRSPRKGAF